MHWFRRCAAVLLLVLVQPAWAVRCVTNNGGIALTESIGKVAMYPVDAPDGYIVWVSPMRTTSGSCYKDLGGALAEMVDPISFYANPGAADSATSGLEIGIRYNGVDYFGAGNQPGTGVPTGYVVPWCSSSDFDSGRCPKVPISVTYQIVVRKKGSWKGTLPATYAAFQLDGANGLNYIHGSFRYSLNDMNTLKPTPCMVEVTVSPDPGVVPFGNVRSSGNAFLPAVPRKPFSLELHKKCNVALKVDGFFETTNTVKNGLLLPAVDSNFGIGIEDQAGSPIPFNTEFVLLNQFSAGDTHQNVTFNAVLKSFGPPKIGPFSATATIRLFLY